MPQLIIYSSQFSPIKKITKSTCTQLKFQKINHEICKNF